MDWAVTSRIEITLRLFLEYVSKLCFVRKYVCKEYSSLIWIYFFRNIIKILLVWECLDSTQRPFGYQSGGLSLVVYKIPRFFSDLLWPGTRFSSSFGACEKFWNLRGCMVQFADSYVWSVSSADLSVVILIFVCLLRDKIEHWQRGGVVPVLKHFSSYSPLLLLLTHRIALSFSTFPTTPKFTLLLRRLNAMISNRTVQTLVATMKYKSVSRCELNPVESPHWW